MKNSAKKPPLNNERPSKKPMIPIILRNSQVRFVAGVGAHLLQPVLRLTLRVLELQVLREANQKREAARLRRIPKGRLRFELPRINRRRLYKVRDISDAELEALDAEINKLVGEAKRDKTNAIKKSGTAEGYAENSRSKS